jgi:hypothetical protein
MTQLRIVVPEDFIADGMASIPEVGDRVGYLLQFHEGRPQANPEVSNRVLARVEVLNEGRLSAGWIDPSGTSHPGTYSMQLHGDGWRAYFRSSRLYQDTATLTEAFGAGWPGVIPIDTETTGVVTRCQLITRVSYPDPAGRHTQPSTDTLGPVPEGQKGFRLGLVPVGPAPQGASGWVAMGPPQDGPWTREAGILVELETSAPQPH